MSLSSSAATPNRVLQLQRLAAAKLYLCTPSRSDHDELRAFFTTVYDAGVDIIQLRDKSISTRDEVESLRILAEVARKREKLFAVNDRADIAALVGADIFHIGQDDLSAAQARELLGPEVLIGQSTHRAEQARSAMEDPDVDYFCTGPLWSTPTKPGRAATGLELVTSTARMLAQAPEKWQRDKVWFTIGGIDVTRITQVREAADTHTGGIDASGTDGVPVRAVVVRAIVDAPDPAAATAELVSLLQ